MRAHPFLVRVDAKSAIVLLSGQQSRYERSAEHFVSVCRHAFAEQVASYLHDDARLVALQEPVDGHFVEPRKRRIGHLWTLAPRGRVGGPVYTLVKSFSAAS